MSRRVLVVEDDPISRKILVRMLASRGWEVEACDSGEAAFRRLGESGPFEAMVTDHVMPGMTGGELVRRALTLFSTMRCVVLSGVAAPADCQNLPWLRKPVDIKELSTVLDAPRSPP